MSQGLPIEGVCIYPATEYISWDNERHATTGILSLPDEDGWRSVHTPLAEELARQQAIMASLRAGGGQPAAEPSVRLVSPAA